MKKLTVDYYLMMELDDLMGQSLEKVKNSSVVQTLTSGECVKLISHDPIYLTDAEWRNAGPWDGPYIEDQNNYYASDELLIFITKLCLESDAVKFIDISALDDSSNVFNSINRLVADHNNYNPRLKNILNEELEANPSSAGRDVLDIISGYIGDPTIKDDYTPVVLLMNHDDAQVYLGDSAE